MVIITLLDQRFVQSLRHFDYLMLDDIKSDYDFSWVMDLISYVENVTTLNFLVFFDINLSFDFILKASLFFFAGIM